MKNTLSKIKFEPDNKHKLSLEVKLIQFFLRLFKTKFIMEAKMISNGFDNKPAIPKKSFYKKYSIIESNLDGRQIWELSLKEKEYNQFSNLLILFLHGGAYMANITKGHWNLIEQLLIKTKGTIIVPDYPLAPYSNYLETYDFLDKLYLKILGKYKDKKIVLMGDSAGGGLALGFVQKLRDERINNEKINNDRINNKENKKLSKVLPDYIILFSPWLDISMSNPDIKSIEKKDLLLTIKGLKSAAEKYAVDIDIKDFMVSPIYGDFKGLCKIAIFTGTNDILNPDARKLKNKLEQQNIDFYYFEYPEMFHDWVIITRLKESKDAIEKVCEILKN